MNTCTSCFAYSKKSVNVCKTIWSSLNTTHMEVSTRSYRNKVFAYINTIVFTNFSYSRKFRLKIVYSTYIKKNLFAL